MAAVEARVSELHDEVRARWPQRVAWRAAEGVGRVESAGLARAVEPIASVVKSEPIVAAMPAAEAEVSAEVAAAVSVPAVAAPVVDAPLPSTRKSLELGVPVAGAGERSEPAVSGFGEDWAKMGDEVRRLGKGLPAFGGSLEALVGGRWFAVGGGLALVVALGLFFKLAVDEGWLGAMPPAWRCLAGVVVGVVMMVVGERERVRGRRWTSAGLSGAGIAGVYLSVLAAYGMFGLVSPGVGFGLLAAVSALGVMVAARAGMASVAGVAFAGAFLAPLLVKVEAGSAAVWPAYMLALLASGQALSVWKGRWFVLVGAGVWAGCSVMGSLWLLEFTPRPTAVLGFGFLAIGWLIVQVAGLVAMVRPRPVRAETGAWVGPVGLSISTGFGAAFLADQFTRELGLELVWVPQAVMLVATLGLVLGVSRAAGLMRAARLRLHTDADQFIAALVLQAGAFALAMIVLATSPATGAVVLALSAVGATAAGRAARARGLEAYGLVLLASAVLKALWGFEDRGWYTAGEPVLGLVPSTWMLVAVLTGLSGMAVGWLYNGPSERRAAPGALLGWGAWLVGVTMVLAGMVDVDAEARSVQVAWVAVAFGLLAWGGLGARVPAVGSAVLALGATAVLWCGKGVIFDSGYWIRNSELMPVLNSGLLVGLAIAGGLWLASRRVKGAELAMWVGGAAVGWLLLVTTLEVARVAVAVTGDVTMSQAAISGWWSICAVGAMLVGGWRKSRPMEGLGLVLLMVATMLALSGLSRVNQYTDGPVVIGLVLSTWWWVATLNAAAALLIGWMVSDAAAGRPAGEQALGQFVWVAGVLMLMGSLMSPGSDPRSVQLAWLAGAAVLMFCRTLEGRVPALKSSVLVMLCAAGHWAGRGVIWDQAYWLDDASLWLVVNSGLLVGLAIAGGLWLASRRVMDKLTAAGLVGAAIFWSLVVTTLEVVRVAPAWTSDETFITAAVSIWWALFGTAMVAGGFVRRAATVRHAGLVLMGLAAAKVVLVDLADVSTGWRIVSFVAVGVLMLGVAGAYAKLPRLLSERAGGDEEEGGGGVAGVRLPHDADSDSH